VNVISKTSKY